MIDDLTRSRILEALGVREETVQDPDELSPEALRSRMDRVLRDAEKRVLDRSND